MTENPGNNPPVQPDPPVQSDPPAQPDPTGPGGSAGATGGGLDPKIGAMLSYLLFGWIGGLVMYFTQKHPEVRFHAAQSILVFAPLTVLQFLLSTIGSAGLGFTGGFGIWALFGLISLAVSLVSFVLWIFLSIKGYNLEHFKMPIVGDMAEEWAAK